MSNNQTSPNTGTNTNTDSEEFGYWAPASKCQDEFSGHFYRKVRNHWNRRSHADEEKQRAFDDHKGRCHNCEGLSNGDIHCAELFGLKISYD